MAYNNGFPMNYGNYGGYMMPQQPQPVQQVQQPQPQNSSMIWVSGEAGAKSYLLAPNTTVVLWDSESQVVYIKSADASGMPSMKILDYTIRDNSTPQVPAVADPVDYVTHEELKKFEEEIKSQIKNLSTNKKEVKKDDK